MLPHISGQEHPAALRADLKVLSALSFFATGTYQRPIGENFPCPMLQPSVSNCVREISQLIINYMAQEWIVFPNDVADIARKKRGFSI